MFVNDRLIFLQLQKTGCSHITRLLETHVGGRELEKHAALKDAKGGRAVLGSIRNPWDWYVSLWAYGCTGQGTLYDILVETEPAEAAVWRGFYQDAEDPDRFRGWLARILSPEGKIRLTEGFGLTAQKDVIGFMTFRFLRLFVSHDIWMQGYYRLSDYDRIAAVADEHDISDRFIRMERLEADLADALQSLGYTVALADLGSEKTNTSKHRPFQDYYDTDSAALVAREERYLIDRFGYQAP